MAYVRKVALPTTPRNCLKCHKKFPSTGPGNRLCVPCNYENAGGSQKVGVNPRASRAAKTPSA